MQTQPHRLHWIPVEPSWLVSGGLVLLAVMPHQIPLAARQTLRNPIGALLAVMLAAWTARQSPVLAAAILLVLAGVWTMPSPSEPFIATLVLNKDEVERKRHWLGETLMSEEPAAIQERTDAPAILKDEVGHEEAKPWYGESAMDEHPRGIQERPVAWRDYDEDGGR